LLHFVSEGKAVAMLGHTELRKSFIVMLEMAEKKDG
jgi:hypothetical protein